MLIRLTEIEDILVVKGEMDTARFPKTDDAEFTLLGSVRYELTVAKFDDTVSIEGPVTFKASLACSRCLE